MEDHLAGHLLDMLDVFNLYFKEQAIYLCPCGGGLYDSLGTGNYLRGSERVRNGEQGLSLLVRVWT